MDWIKIRVLGKTGWWQYWPALRDGIERSWWKNILPGQNNQQGIWLSALCSNGSCLLFLQVIALGYNIHMDSWAVANVQKKDGKIATCFASSMPAENSKLFLQLFHHEVNTVQNSLLHKILSVENKVFFFFSSCVQSNSPRITSKLVLSQMSAIVTNKYW